MEDDLKVCRNRSCARRDILVEAVGRKAKCECCGHKLSYATTSDTSRSSWSERLFNDAGSNGGVKYGETKYLSAHYQAAPSDTWSRPADVTGCPLIKGDIALVAIPMYLYHTWIYLAKEFKTEWLAYLNGNRNEETGVYTITDMYIPKQKATWGHCSALEGEVKSGTIGCVHSHVDFGTFFSGEDRDHFNHPVEIVVNRSGSLLYAARFKLKCGEWSRIESRNWTWLGDEKMLETAIELESKLELEGAAAKEAAKLTA